MKWAHHPNLRKRPRTPSRGRGSDNGILSPTASAGTGGVSSWTRVRSGTGRRVLARLRAAFAERASRGIGLESSVTRRYDKGSCIGGDAGNRAVAVFHDQG